MNFLRYVRDNIRLLALYFAAAAFLLAMRALGVGGMASGDVVYTAVVTALLYAVFVGIDFSIRRRQARRLAALIASPDKSPVLPPAQDFKDEQYAELIEGLYAKHTNDINKLEEDYREGKEFMAAWAHEAKTPVTAARLLLEQGLREDTAESLAEEVERVNQSIERILFYSRSDSFTKDYVITEENLLELAREHVKKHSTLFIRKRIRLSLEIPVGLTVQTDRKWLLFILDQLLSNALKYTPESGEITISAKTQANETVLAYRDNGTGIRAEDIGRIFDKSFTGRNGREPGSAATGLGLYLAQKLARKLGHDIVISSQFGEGTTAEIHFPRLEDLAGLTKP